MAGYSANPLSKKLGLKPEMKCILINAPKDYFSLIEIPEKDLKLEKSSANEIDFVHLFTSKEKELSDHLKQLKNQIRSNGIIWVSWPKKSSKIPSEIDENKIREIALPMGLVDVKVCAVDEVWSGLKLVIRIQNR